MTRGSASPGDPIEIEAGRLVGGGRVLAHKDGETFMVAGALPGERVSATELSRRSGIVEATTVRLLGPAHPARVQIPCRHAPSCGGCDWPHVDPERGARLKSAAVAEAIRRF